jgi:aconitate hydratase
MGVLPLQYQPGQNAASLGLTGEEALTIRGLAKLAPKAVLEVEAKRPSGEVVRFKAIARVDDPVDLDYMRHGGVLQLVFRQILAKS